MYSQTILSKINYTIYIMYHIFVIFFFLMIRRPPRSTLFSLHDALPISDFDFASSPILVDLPNGKHALIAGQKSGDRKSTRLNSSHGYISYAVFCLKKKKI